MALSGWACPAALAIPGLDRWRFLLVFPAVAWPVGLACVALTLLFHLGQYGNVLILRHRTVGYKEVTAVCSRRTDQLPEDLGRALAAVATGSGTAWS